MVIVGMVVFRKLISEMWTDKFHFGANRIKLIQSDKTVIHTNPSHDFLVVIFDINFSPCHGWHYPVRIPNRHGTDPFFGFGFVLAVITDLAAFG